MDFVIYFLLNVNFRRALKELIWLVVKAPMKCLGKKDQDRYIYHYKASAKKLPVTKTTSQSIV